MPKLRAKMRTQNRYSVWKMALPVASHRPSSTARKLARPMVKLGNRMWNAMVNANCSRDRISASRSMPRIPCQPVE